MNTCKDNTMKKRFGKIMTQDQLNSIQERNDILILDIHGYRRKEGMWLVDTVVKLADANTKVCVIHGYRHGTVLKEAVKGYSCTIRKVDVLPDPYNKGRTLLEVA